MSSTNFTIEKTKLRSNKSNIYLDNNFILDKDIEWFFSPDLLSKYELRSTTFDFFIEWEYSMHSGKLNPDIWFKRKLNLSNKEDTINCSPKIVIPKLYNLDTIDYIKNTNLFFKSNKLHPRYMIIKDYPDEFSQIKSKSDNSKTVTLPRFNNIDKNICFSYPFSLNFKSSDLETFTLKQLQELLVENSGKRFNMSKDLSFSQTYLECYLAYTADKHGATWPGDCDLLFYDSEFKCICIIEFKKCTQNGSSIRMKDQSFLNYQADKIKYKRLGILREHFENMYKKSVPIITVFYPTKSRNESIIKLERIDGNYKTLTSGESILIDIPNKYDSDTLNKFKETLIDNILKLCTHI